MTKLIAWVRALVVLAVAVVVCGTMAAILTLAVNQASMAQATAQATAQDEATVTAQATANYDYVASHGGRFYEVYTATVAQDGLTMCANVASHTAVGIILHSTSVPCGARVAVEWVDGVTVDYEVIGHHSNAVTVAYYWARGFEDGRYTPQVTAIYHR